MCEFLLALYLLILTHESADYHDMVAVNIFVNGRDVEYSPDNVTYERLSVEESVGQIFLRAGGVTGGLQIAPAALPLIRRIIRNPNLKHFHTRAINKLALAGDADDVKVLAEYVERRRGKELGKFSSTAVSDVFWTLATMSNRHIDGADELLRKMCLRDFWKDFIVENANEWDRSDEILVAAIANLSRTQCKDLDKVIQQALGDTPERTRRDGIKRLLDVYLADCVVEWDWRIYPWIPSYSRKQAVANFNDDLENPGPRQPDK